MIKMTKQHEAHRPKQAKQREKKLIKFYVQFSWLKSFVCVRQLCGVHRAGYQRWEAVAALECVARYVAVTFCYLF